MIRKAKSTDNWRHYNTGRRKYKYLLDEVDLNGSYGLNDFKINSGIFAICGLNGTGKSTIISFLKDIIGINLSEFDIERIKDHEVYASYPESNNILCNKDSHRYSDFLTESNIGLYIDYNECDQILSFLRQNNLEEYLEQFESFSYGQDELDMLNFLIGKKYSQCEVTEIDDDNGKIYPYFKVISDNVTYDNIRMGAGEHFLFVIYWYLNKVKNSKIVIIEEPETCISINSQKNLMNYIASITMKFGISFILSTHSPYIIEKIKKEHLIVVNKLLNKSKFITPYHKLKALESLGMYFPKSGVFYFEDELAVNFFKEILFNLDETEILDFYNIKILNGESFITEALSTEVNHGMNYRIIGIYDGDMISKKEEYDKKVKNEYLFLPCSNEMELELREILEANIDSYCKLAGITFENLTAHLTIINDNEYHDWYNALELFAHNKGYNNTRILTKLWIHSSEKNKQECENFIDILIKKSFIPDEIKI